MSTYLGSTPINVLNVLFRTEEAVALYRGSTLLLRFSSSGFNPLDLFTGGKQGVWYDPSDKSTLFQDVAGTVPVTKDGDPVALMKDKSGNGNHAVQTVSTARPIYKTDGILHWLAFDGIDDRLNITLSSAVSAPFTIAMGEKREGFNSTFNYLIDSAYPNKFSLYIFGENGAMSVVRANSTFTSGVNSPINTAKAIFHNQVGLTGKVKSNSSATQTFVLTDSPAITSITLMSTIAATGNVKGNIYSFLLINSDIYDNAEMYDYVTRQSGVTL